MSNQMGIQNLLRAQSVKRWTIVQTVKDQSLAEHTFNVTMIARAICKELRHDDAEVTKAALAHDLDEIFTGDIPTPFKTAAREKGVELNDIYEKVTNRKLSDLDSRIVKIADIVEAYWFIREFGVGRHANEVTTKLSHQMAKEIGHNDTEQPLQASFYSACWRVVGVIQSGELLV